MDLTSRLLGTAVVGLAVAAGGCVSTKQEAPFPYANFVDTVDGEQVSFFRNNDKSGMPSSYSLVVAQTDGSHIREFFDDDADRQIDRVAVIVAGGSPQYFHRTDPTLGGFFQAADLQFGGYIAKILAHQPEIQGLREQRRADYMTNAVDSLTPTTVDK